MLKNRSLWSGMGSGLIIGAVMLQLMNVALGAVEEPQAQEAGALKLEEVEEWAEEKGYRLMTEAQLDELIAKSVHEATAKAQETAPPEAPAPAPLKIVVVLSGGLNAADIASAFYRSGVIDDAQAFQDALRKRNLTGKLRAGYYEFDGPQDIDGAIEAITNQS